MSYLEVIKAEARERCISAQVPVKSHAVIGARRLPGTRGCHAAVHSVASFTESLRRH